MLMLLVLLVGAGGSTAVAQTVPSTSGIQTSNLDRTCKACDDFYRFANGGWIAKHPIPAAYSSIGNFRVLYDRNFDVLRGLLDDPSLRVAAAGTNARKLGEFYAACMDTNGIAAAGIAPLAPEFATIAGVRDPRGLGAPLAQLASVGVGAFFSASGGPDQHDSRTTIVQLRQGGLGLPDRDYYVRDDAKSVALRAAYTEHVAKTFVLLGDAPADATREAAGVVALETAMAAQQLGRVDMRDPAATDHRMTFAELVALAPAFDWKTYFAAAGIPTTVAVNVAQPKFFAALSSLLGTLSGVDLRAYLRWQATHAFAGALAGPIDDENFSFYGKTLNGTTEQLPRWKRCVSATDQNLGEALGELYVAKAFPASAKSSALEMVANLRSTLRDDFATLAWMTPATRTKAIAKLDAFQLKIGYPDTWLSYAKLDVVPDAYVRNVAAGAAFRRADSIGRIGKPVDRARWGMTPPTVNAYYSPSINEIVFPAGILQPPFFDANADMAVNYGGIGAVIGHEATHGFDDQGRKYGPDGNLSDTWSPEDALRFNARADCIVKQYDALSPAPGVVENGKLVQGEAIADIGGMTIAYKAFQKWQATHPRRTIDGFSPEQRFFMGWAQVWASNERPESIALRAKTDVHAFDKFRVNATLANMPEFASAWFCKLNQAMVRPPAQRCQIW
ncbi:MAG: M13 family metallopeptidase [Vulcanimicrobiaceae bacterium]